MDEQVLNKLSCHTSKTPFCLTCSIGYYELMQAKGVFGHLLMPVMKIITSLCIYAVYTRQALFVYSIRTLNVYSGQGRNLSDCAHAQLSKSLLNRLGPKYLSLDLPFCRCCIKPFNTLRYCSVQATLLDGGPMAD